MVFWIKFILALCSIAYELLLAQAMTAFLANTVLRYSVTIGLYLFAMGLGALFIDRRMQRPHRTLWVTEVLLTLVGALSVASLFFVDHLLASRLALLIWGHGLIIFIGFLTGLELPLILRMHSGDGAQKRNQVIAVDYAGAFAGSLVFVFLLYPVVGLIASVFWIALLNAIAGGLILYGWPKDQRPSRGLWLVQGVIILLVAAALFWAPSLERSLIGLYLGS